MKKIKKLKRKKIIKKLKKKKIMKKVMKLKKKKITKIFKKKKIKKVTKKLKKTMKKKTKKTTKKLKRKKFDILRQSKKVIDIKLLGKEKVEAKSPEKLNEKESPKRGRYGRKDITPTKEEIKQEVPIFKILRQSKQE